MTFSKDIVAAFKAIQLTNQTLDGNAPENSEELIREYTREAGGAAEMIAGLLSAGDLLIRALAAAVDEPVETVFAEILED